MFCVVSLLVHVHHLFCDTSSVLVTSFVQDHHTDPTCVQCMSSSFTLIHALSLTSNLAFCISALLELSFNPTLARTEQLKSLTFNSVVALTTWLKPKPYL